MTPLILSAALVLDALLGEPKWLWSRIPHPAILMGRLINWCDQTFNTAPVQKAKGTACVIALCLGALLLGLAIQSLPYSWSLQILITAILLAQKSLVQHVQNTADALRLSVFDGRLAVAQIVGRDTSEMTRPDIARGAIESAAENLSDGVIAPAFWFLVAGLPGLLVYKITNTADSMIGYKTDRHQDFGWAAARFDDFLNFIPARLTAFLIALSDRKLKAWQNIAKDAALHRSPNAGWPESAMARALNISLAGPRSYEGQRQDFPFVHLSGRKDAGPADIDASVGILWRVWALFFAITLILVALF